MTDEKWQFVIGHIKDNFELTDQREEDIPEDVGRGSVQIVEFNGPLGKMRLERTTQPLIIDKKTISSRRIGSGTDVEYIYSETEKVHKFRAFKFDESTKNWVEMEMKKEEMFFY